MIEPAIYVCDKISSDFVTGRFCSPSNIEVGIGNIIDAWEKVPNSEAYKFGVSAFQRKACEHVSDRTALFIDFGKVVKKHPTPRPPPDFARSPFDSG